MKHNKANLAVIIVCSAFLFILLFISIKDYTNQIDVNERIDNLKVVEYVEGQQIEQIDPEALSAYLSSLDHRTVSHEILVAIIGVFFTFLAFYVQFSFNASQRDDMSKERFENGYAHYLDVFRSIWKDIEIPIVGSGKIAMHYMFYEYKAIYNQLLESNVLENNDTDRLNKVAFSIFLNGVSENLGSDIQICKLGRGEIKRINKLCDNLMKARHDCEQGDDKGVTYIMDYKGKGIKYFDGHRMRLVPYFKYLISILDYIRENENRYANKETTLKQLFSEMSDHEIGLIYSYLKFRSCKGYDDYLELMKTSIDPEYSFKFLFDSSRFIRKSA